MKNISLRQDEDHLAIKKKKARTPKPRDKWSLLWFIPSQVLNSREEESNGRGQVVKKGKRLGFDRFNQLSCKLCRKVFHKFQNFAFHNDDEHDGQTNPAPLNVRPRVQHQPAVVQRTYSEPVRKSSRVSSKPVSYDEDIEILEIDVSPMKPKDIDATKFGKLTLSAKRKIVEENNEADEYITRQSKFKQNKSHTAHEISEKSNIGKNLASNVCKEDEEILLIEEEDEKVDDKRQTRNSQLSKSVQKRLNTVKKDENKDHNKNEEILLTEIDDDIIDKKETGKRQKPSSEVSKPAEKRLKTIKNVEANDLIEVKSSSGKSMMVSKAALEKIMKSKSVQTAVANMKVAVDNNNTEVKSDDKIKQSSKIESPPVEKRRTRSMGC